MAAVENVQPGRKPISSPAISHNVARFHCAGSPVSSSGPHAGKLERIAECISAANK